MVIPEPKITQYLLSLTHRDGRSKAIFFRSFGFVPEKWYVLAAALRHHALVNEVSETVSTPFGTNFIVEGKLETPDGRKPYVRVIWFIAMGEHDPRLATAYSQKGKRND